MQKNLSIDSHTPQNHFFMPANSIFNKFADDISMFFQIVLKISVRMIEPSAFINIILKTFQNISIILIDPSIIFFSVFYTCRNSFFMQKIIKVLPVLFIFFYIQNIHKIRCQFKIQIRCILAKHIPLF